MQDDRAFFQALQSAFGATLSRAGRAPGAIDALLSQAIDTFDGNLAMQCKGEAALDCSRGCAACCTLRVVATAPELLLIARFLRAVQPRLSERGIDLVGGLRAADANTRGLSEQRRVGLRQRCAFVANGVCVIYGVRPLACRGHASSDRRACADAAAGRLTRVPHSNGHRRTRALVQNALQSALRDAGLAWGLCELNHGLLIALDGDGAERDWLAGADPFASAMVDDVPAAEMAAAFDQLRPTTP
jgi:Fe-S-cluster containining protein